MIDERIRIEYRPMSPSDDGRQGQHEVMQEVEQLVGERGVLGAGA